MSRRAGSEGAGRTGATVQVPGRDEVAGLRASASRRGASSQFRDNAVPPLSAGFTFFGGLYRGVQLLALDLRSISPLDDASSGVYLKQEKITPDRAELQVTARLRNGGPAARKAIVTCELLDTGKVVRAKGWAIGPAEQEEDFNLMHGDGLHRRAAGALRARSAIL